MYCMRKRTTPPHLASRRQISHSEPTKTPPVNLVSSTRTPSFRSDSVDKLYSHAHSTKEGGQKEDVLLLDFASPHVTEHVDESRRQQGLEALPMPKVEISRTLG